MNPARRAIQAVAAAFGVPASAILGPSRKRRVSVARFAVYALLKERRWTTTQIGAALGLDHSSVVHGQKRAAKMDEAWRRKYEIARDIVGGKPIPAWRIVYASPIGSPVKPEEPKPVASAKPKPLTHDDVWAAKLAGARFKSVAVREATPYREAMPENARVIA